MSDIPENAELLALLDELSGVGQGDKSGSDNHQEEH